MANGVAAGAQGKVDFRIKATNELGTVVYSNTVQINITTYVAFNSIGVIGDATAGGWGTDTDMYRPDPANNPASWLVTMYLTGGGLSAKFRADDGWTDNWGASAFPSGTGTPGGANVPISSSGYYQISFNAGTGAYTFTPVTTTVYSFVSLIGAQTSWGSDITDLTQDPNNNQVWTGTVALSVGELKFRADHAWTVNWGKGQGDAALSGWGVPNGPNIAITTAGNYYVYINVATGEYFFANIDNNASAGTPYTLIGLIGDFNGWATDAVLIKDPANPYKWSAKIALTAGGVKFRADAGWNVNWGDSAFPSGTGAQGGANIPVTTGTFQITFNSATGEYSFSN